MASPGSARSTTNTTTATPSSVTTMPASRPARYLQVIGGSSAGDRGQAVQRLGRVGLEAAHALGLHVVGLVAEQPHPRRVLQQLLLELREDLLAVVHVGGAVALLEQLVERRVGEGG